MTKKRLLIIAGIVAVPVLALAWWLGSPLFLDDEVNETFPTPVAAPASTTTTTSPGEVQMTTVAPSEEPPSAPSQPVALLAGNFVDADESHMGTGTATIYELEDGSRVLRLEAFEVTNGPDLHVLLVPGDGSMDGAVNLGSLKGNVGDQNYEIPGDVDIETLGDVLIYCVAFSVNFATATLG